MSNESKRKRGKGSSQTSQKRMRPLPPSSEDTRSSDDETSDCEVGGVTLEDEDSLASKTSATPRTADRTLPNRHVRFGSEDPSSSGVDLSGEATDGDSSHGGDEESDDEAPEDVSAATALRSARSAEAAVTKAAEDQREEKRRKRKEKDDRLKAQATTASKKQARKERKLAKAVAKHNPVEGAAPAKQPTATHMAPDSDEEEPELLPDELLMHASERPPTPPPAQQEAKLDGRRRRKKLRLDRPPEDRQAGQIKVRVLEKNNGVLAPKAVQRGKDRREAWLSGRPSGEGIRAFERRPMNAGFFSR